MKIVLFNLCFFSALIGYSQDIIVKLNGDTVLAQVLEVQLTDIVYQTPTVPAKPGVNPALPQGLPGLPGSIDPFSVPPSPPTP